MFSDSIEQAREAFRTGRYAKALELARRAAPAHKREAEERRCLICECTQFQGVYKEALEDAASALERDLRPEYVARYWCVIGRIRLDQQERQEAAENLTRALRAAERSEQLAILAEVQQLWLIAVAENLGAGLLPAVREAYATAVRTADAGVLAGFHLRLSRLEAQRGAFAQSAHHLSLAQSLLARCEHLAYSALYHVNKACLLTLLGRFDEARHEGEAGAILAGQAGHIRLGMAAAATVAHAAVSTGATSIATHWLANAKQAAERLEITEIGLLESLASMALLQGDSDIAEGHLHQARCALEAQGPQWSTAGAYVLLTEAHFHKTRGNTKEYARVLDAVRAISTTQNDAHSGLLVTLAEAETSFEEGNDAIALGKVTRCFTAFVAEVSHLVELDRMRARALWKEGRRASAKRKLLRASAIAAKASPRWKWAEALGEARSIRSIDPSEGAYSFAQQTRRVDTKFAALATKLGDTWFERAAPPADLSRDALDGFDDAIGILDLSQETELRGREALASILALGISEGAALVTTSPSGLTLIGSSGWTKSDAQKALQRANVARVAVGQVDSRTYELIVLPKDDLRSIIAVAGVKKLVDAASALEAHKKDQQRLGALWQPEDIIEEPGAVFSSPKMIELMLTARKVAATRLPVLLLGPTGTGKEVIAHAIHRASPRASKVFLAFNCSAVPRDMVESQLFGYRRGSFTGATDDFPGIIRSAEGGTLFLDEIGELSIDLQPKLLRFLETNEVHPLGEGRPIKVDVRVIAATNANLDDLIERKTFREDLYYRLNIVRFHMPQLSERREEIPALATHLLREAQVDEGKHSIKISDEVMEYLLLYKWPGNIRQLSNEMRRMVAMVESSETLMADHLTPAIRKSRKTVAASTEGDAAAADGETQTTAPGNSMTLPLEQPLPDAVEALERAMIEHAIARAGGKVEEAARLLGISRKGLFLKRRRWLGDDTPSNDV